MNQIVKFSLKQQPFSRLIHFKTKLSTAFFDYPPAYDPSKFLPISGTIFPGETLTNNFTFAVSDRDNPVGYDKSSASVLFKSLAGGYYYERFPMARQPIANTDASVRGYQPDIHAGLPGKCTVGFFVHDGWRSVFARGLFGNCSNYAGEVGTVYCMILFCIKYGWVPHSLLTRTDCPDAKEWIYATSRIPLDQLESNNFLRYIRRAMPELRKRNWVFAHINRRYNTISDCLCRSAQEDCHSTGVIEVSDQPPISDAADAFYPTVSWGFRVVEPR